MMQRLVLGALAAFCLLNDPLPSDWKTAHMTPPSPRVQALLSTLEPHCFGRFLIDLPHGAIPAWGSNHDVDIVPGRAGDVDRLVKETEDARKQQERYPLTRHLTLYFETRAGSLPGMKHVISQKDFDSTDQLRIETFYAVGESLASSRSYALTETLDKIIAEVEDVAHRVRPRANDAVPTDPGQCIDNGFIADRPNAANEPVRDFLDVGFRLKDPPDVHLSISIEAANEEWAKPGLEKTVIDTENDAWRHGERDPFKAFTTLRRARREIHDWKDGFEMLTKTHGTEASRPHHDFWMIFAGQIDKLHHPYVDIRLSDGVADNATGAVDPTLTDAEAIALWDAVTATIRVRPTSTATSAAPLPEAPLGTRVVTGDPCPRTGLWECAFEADPVQGGRRHWLRTGETMPSALLLGPPTLLQRLRGEAPRFASRTVWTLVSVDGAAPAA